MSQVHDEPTPSDADAAPYHPSAALYAVIYVLLMALLALTVTGFFLLEGVSGTAVALGIAGVKALLVMLYFMHVRFASRVTWAFAGAAFLWLGILMALTLSDYLSRPTLPQRIILQQGYHQERLNESERPLTER